MTWKCGLEFHEEWRNLHFEVLKVVLYHLSQYMGDFLGCRQWEYSRIGWSCPFLVTCCLNKAKTEKPVPFGFLFGHPCQRNMCDLNHLTLQKISLLSVSSSSNSRGVWAAWEECQALPLYMVSHFWSPKGGPLMQYAQHVEFALSSPHFSPLPTKRPGVWSFGCNFPARNVRVKRHAQTDLMSREALNL